MRSSDLVMIACIVFLIIGICLGVMGMRETFHKACIEAKVGFINIDTGKFQFIKIE